MARDVAGVLSPLARRPDTTHRFDGGVTNEALRLIERARIKITGFDQTDGGMDHLPADLQLRTVLQAILAGIQTQSWDCVAEAYCMLQDAELAIRQAIYKEKSR